MHQQARELMLLEVDEVELQLETTLLPPLTSPAPSASPLRPNHLQRKETTLFFCSPATFVLNKAHLEHHALAVRTNGEHAALQLLSTRLSRADHAPPEQSLVNDNNLPPGHFLVLHMWPPLCGRVSCLTSFPPCYVFAWCESDFTGHNRCQRFEQGSGAF